MGISSWFGGGKKAPTSTQAQAAAAPIIAQQQKQNTANAQQQAAYNRPDQENQYGSTIDWQFGGLDANGNPIFRQVQGLGATGNEFAQGFAGLGRQYNTLAGQFAGQAPPSSMDAFNKADEYWSQANQPYLDRQKEALRTQLENQGFNVNDAAYTNAMDDLAKQQSQARASFLTGAQGQFFNQGLQGLQQQENSLGLLQPGVGFGSQSITGGFAGIPGINVANTDIAGITQQQYEDLLKQYGIEQQQNSSMIGGLAGLGGTIGGAILGGPVGAALGGKLGSMIGTPAEYMQKK